MSIRTGGPPLGEGGILIVNGKPVAWFTVASKVRMLTVLIAIDGWLPLLKEEAACLL